MYFRGRHFKLDIGDIHIKGVTEDDSDDGESNDC